MAEDFNVIPGAFKALAASAFIILVVVVVVPLALGLMFFSLSIVESLLKH